MTKKNRKKKNNKQAEIKSEEAQISPMESNRLVPEGESFVSVQNTQEEIGETSRKEQVEDRTDDNSVSESTPDLSDEDSVEDLLDHVRQSFVTKRHRGKKNVQVVEPGVDGASGTQIETAQTNLQDEPAVVNSDTQETAIENPKIEEPKEEVSESAMHEGESEALINDSMDDVLADVRQSLMEEDEAGKSEKKSSWWNRLVKGTSNQEAPTASVAEETEEDVPVVDIHHSVTEPEEKESDENIGEIDELIKLLETDVVEDQEKTSDISVQVPPPAEQEVKIDVDELKKQAFSPRTEEEKAEDFNDVRQVALGGGEEEIFIEVESKAADPWEERIKAAENAFRPYRTYIYYGLALIGVVMAVMASVLVFNGVKQSLSTPEPTQAINLPYPTTLSLPGGLNFSLAKGSLKDGSWNPRGPEWLEGTEICRWVAIPWSRQLEAAVRTLTPDDVLVLLMSNNDKIPYKVESIQELTTTELQVMDSSSPCLALILAKQDSEKRWVAVGRP